jgi:23S rRNA (uracil1939-C5)-methyltransferase
MVMTPGQIVPLTIEKPAAGGRMLARVDGQVVLVGGAIPGERVRARVERVTRAVAYADTVSVEEASPDRREPAADPACGGSLFAHIDYSRQLSLKAEILTDACARIGRFKAPIGRVHGSPSEGYRMRARLHVRDGRAGFFREGTHALCDARATCQLLAATTDAIDGLLETLTPEGLAALQELEVSENVEGDGRAVHLALSRPADAWEPSSALPSGITGVSIGTPMQSAALTVAAGSPFVKDSLECGGRAITLRRHVLSFFQGNRFLLARLVEHVLERIDPLTTVFDLYAGVGLFALPLAAARQARVTAVEGERLSALDLEANASGLDGAVEVARQSVEVFLNKSRPRPDAVIVDPPRTGMSPEAMAGVTRLGVPRVVYVSCDVATLARDGRRLLDHGYACEGMDAFDMFPNTPHVETVALFRRV